MNRARKQRSDRLGAMSARQDCRGQQKAPDSVRNQGLGCLVAGALSKKARQAAWLLEFRRSRGL